MIRRVRQRRRFYDSRHGIGVIRYEPSRTHACLDLRKSSIKRGLCFHRLHPGRGRVFLFMRYASCCILSRRIL
jgi:hypothetical protein